MVSSFSPYSFFWRQDISNLIFFLFTFPRCNIGLFKSNSAIVSFTTSSTPVGICWQILLKSLNERDFCITQRIWMLFPWIMCCIARWKIQTWREYEINYRKILKVIIQKWVESKGGEPGWQYDDSYVLETIVMMLQNGVIWIMCDIFIISSKNMKMNLKKIIHEKTIIYNKSAIYKTMKWGSGYGKRPV